jgi:NAD(P)-dependent dehydrogenase (short-subunit alcohol dehydrogenase family)
MTGLRGTTVILTGATGGFGRAIARTLAEAGAGLVLTGRRRNVLTEVARGLRDTGAVVRTVPVDLADASAMEPVAAEALRCFGRIDALVNNAGVFGPLGPTWEIDGRDWWQVMEVNLRGTLSGCRAVLPHMTARGHGRIVNITSNAGHARWPLASAYSVSKAAVGKLTENLAAEARRHGIMTFAYHPGLLDVGLTKSYDKLVEQYGPVAEPIAAWITRRLEGGEDTPLRSAVAALVSLLDGSADHLSGRYVTVHDGGLTALAGTEPE